MIAPFFSSISVPATAYRGAPTVPLPAESSPDRHYLSDDWQALVHVFPWEIHGAQTVRHDPLRPPPFSGCFSPALSDPLPYAKETSEDFRLSHAAASRSPSEAPDPECDCLKADFQKTSDPFHHLSSSRPHSPEWRHRVVPAFRQAPPLLKSENPRVYSTPPSDGPPRKTRT